MKRIKIFDTTLRDGLRTGDIMEEGMQRVGCAAMGRAIVERI